MNITPRSYNKISLELDEGGPAQREWSDFHPRIRGGKKNLSFKRIGGKREKKREGN